MTTTIPLANQPANYQPPHKLHGLDHLRALAIILVIGFHYSRLFPHPIWIESVFRFGWTGVDLFFVLSGYLISSQLFAQIAKQQTVSAREFYFKRILRIFPAYAAILLVYYLFPAFREKGGLQPLWKLITFTANFGLDRNSGSTFSHVWSLCVEEQFYLLFPLIVIAAVQFKKTKSAFVLLAVLFLSGFLIRQWIWSNSVAAAFNSDKFFYIWLKEIYYPTYNRLDGLLMGISIAGIFQFVPSLRNRLINYGNKILLAGMLLAIAAYFVCKGFSTYKTSIWGFPLVAIACSLLVTAVICPSCFLFNFSSAISQKIATLSYALYLSHKGMIHIAHDFFSGKGIDGNSNLMLLISMAFCIAGALLLHYLIEQPFLRLRNKLLLKRKRKYQQVALLA